MTSKCTKWTCLLILDSSPCPSRLSFCACRQSTMTCSRSPWIPKSGLRWLIRWPQGRKCFRTRSSLRWVVRQRLALETYMPYMLTVVTFKLINVLRYQCDGLATGDDWPGWHLCWYAAAWCSKSLSRTGWTCHCMTKAGHAACCVVVHDLPGW